MGKIELLSPAGDMSKLKTAFYYGADAVYIGGKSLSLRAMAGNFTDEEIVEAINFAHNIGKKVYITVNILARNYDLEQAEKYLRFLESAKADGVIISDVGLVSLALEVAPNLPVNLSTQANTTNLKSVEFWKKQGVKRVILARELSIEEVSQIHNANPDIEIETFIHGAMCISYSGRCLLSDYLSGRPSNRGECVQACRWEYEIREKSTDGKFLTMEEDGRGTYIMNSKDLCLIDYIEQLENAGVISFKIEGRMKSEYYLATVVNAYRRAIDEYYRIGKDYKENNLYKNELEKTAHREFTTAFALGKNDKTINYDDSQSKGTYKFMASVIEDYNGEYAVIEMRNRFKVGDELEVLSPNDTFNQVLTVEKMKNERGDIVEDAKLVQQKLKIYTNISLKKGDILRKRA